MQPILAYSLLHFDIGEQAYKACDPAANEDSPFSPLYQICDTRANHCGSLPSLNTIA